MRWAGSVVRVLPAEELRADRAIALEVAPPAALLLHPVVASTQREEVLRRRRSAGPRSRVVQVDETRRPRAAPHPAGAVPSGDELQHGARWSVCGSGGGGQGSGLRVEDGAGDLEGEGLQHPGHDVRRNPAQPGESGPGHGVPGGDLGHDSGARVEGKGTGSATTRVLDRRDVDPGQCLAGGGAELVDPDRLAGRVVDHRVVVVEVDPVPDRRPPGRTGRLITRDDGHSERHARRDGDVPEHEVTEGIGTGLVEGQRVVDLPVLGSELVHCRPHRRRLGRRQQRPPCREPVLTRADLHRPGPAGPRCLRLDLVGGDPGCELSRRRGDPSRVHRGERGASSASTASHASTSSPAHASTTLCAETTGSSPDSTRSRVAGNRSPRAAPSAALRPATPSVTPVAKDSSAGAIASTKPTGCTRSTKPCPVSRFSTRAPQAPATATRPSAAWATFCASPATRNASSGDHRRPPCTTSRPSAAHCVRSTARRSWMSAGNIPDDIEHVFVMQPLSTPLGSPGTDAGPHALPDPVTTRCGRVRG